MISTGVLIISDSSAKAQREDKTGPLLIKYLEKSSFKVDYYKIVPDDKNRIIHELKALSDKKKLNLVFTSGGTGLSIRDVTPEATKKVIKKEVPGIAEFIRSISLKKTDRAILSRGTAGVRKRTLIINLPGSPKAIKEIIPKLVNPLIHGIDILLGVISG